MGRAELRRQQREAAGKKKTYTLTVEQIEQLKEDVMQEAVNKSMVLLFSISVLVLHEKYGWGGKKRLPEFAEHLSDYYQEFVEGSWTFAQYKEMVFKYTGIRFEYAPDELRT